MEVDTRLIANVLANEKKRERQRIEERSHLLQKAQDNWRKRLERNRTKMRDRMRAKQTCLKDEIQSPRKSEPSSCAGV